MTKSADLATLLDSTSKIPIADLSASGTPDASTFLRGDGAWQSPAGGVTSLAAGGGITVSGSTGAVTVSQDFYTGTSGTNTSFPIGSYIITGGSSDVIASTATIYVQTSSASTYFTKTSGAGRTAITGTWRARGSGDGSSEMGSLWQRTA
jgi:hypothetical protein